MLRPIQYKLKILPSILFSASGCAQFTSSFVFAFTILRIRNAFWLKMARLKITLDLEYTNMLAKTKSLERDDVMLHGLASEHLFQTGSCRCQILGFFGDYYLGIECTLEAETLMSNLTQYKLFIGNDKKVRSLEQPSPLRLPSLPSSR